jgi:lipopolysaccharide/colanic/teichoic acid biosynthesis glycosyltransferase
MLPVEISRVQNDESLNDGSCVNMYYHDESAVWVAYGRSAYALRLLVKRNGYDCLRAFSNRLQLPCTVVSDYVIRLLGIQCQFECETDGSRMQLQLQEPFVEGDYKRWVIKISQSKIIDPLQIKTPVSDLVPKDEFIYDSMSSFARIIKRIFDCISALVLMVVFSPLFLICYVLIRREDGGPAMYKQERIGRFGRPFYIYKFRSMHMDAEKMGPQLTQTGGKDKRLTKIGRFIRAHHLDELPQLYNVFIGDMSFVGPRPERKFYIDQIMEYDKRYVYLYQIRPGVTSPATLYNGYTDTMAKMLSRLEYDLFYLGHRSWWIDISILFKTFCRIIFGKIF